jgi:hypothetical protein
MSFDTKCYDLAEYFLADHYAPAQPSEATKREMAQAIQDGIEMLLATLGETASEHDVANVHDGKGSSHE